MRNMISEYTCTRLSVMHYNIETHSKQWSTAVRVLRMHRSRNVLTLDRLPERCGRFSRNEGTYSRGIVARVWICDAGDLLTVQRIIRSMLSDTGIPDSAVEALRCDVRRRRPRPTDKQTGIQLIVCETYNTCNTADPRNRPVRCRAYSECVT